MLATFIFWALLLIVLGFFSFMLGCWMATKIGPGGIEGLVEKVRNKENADRVDRLILYHNSRMRQGANEKESLARLERELKGIQNEG